MRCVLYSGASAALGSGIYFWEYGDRRALDWATGIAKRRPQIVETPAVIGAHIHLGVCFDLLDVRFTEKLSELYPAFEAGFQAQDISLPRNEPAHGNDRDLARRKLGDEYVRYMLDDAIDLLPPSKLCKIARKYLDLKRLRPDAPTAAKVTLIEEVRRFAKASLAGEYYASFDVNSRNCTKQSAGTSAWISTFHRLLDRCVTAAKQGNPAEVREAMDTLFDLLDRIDECRDDIIFFADEGGSWQVGVDWARVLPVWFKVLSVTAQLQEYAQRITGVLANHYNYGRDKMLAVARRLATPPQRKALASA